MSFMDILILLALAIMIFGVGYAVYMYTNKQFRLMGIAAVLILTALVIRISPLHGMGPIDIKLSFDAITAILLVAGVIIALTVSFFYIRGRNAVQQIPTTSPKKNKSVSTSPTTAQPTVTPAQPAPVTPAQPVATANSATPPSGQPTP